MMRITLGGTSSVSALLTHAADPFAMLVLAHGAGAGMTHSFMEDIASHLAASGVSVLRYQFPYMEAGSKRPDSPAVARGVVRAAVEAAAGLISLPLFAGGKSFGGRMTSQAQAASSLPGVRGLVFLGFPLHPAGKPSMTRASHLDDIDVPMLFLQGTRDALAELALLEGVVGRLQGASLSLENGADHVFHVLARSRRTDAEVRHSLCARASGWTRDVLSGRS